MIPVGADELTPVCVCPRVCVWCAGCEIGDDGAKAITGLVNLTSLKLWGELMYGLL